MMSRIKALYRSWAIPCSGTTVYAVRHRSRVVGQDFRTRGSPAGRTVLSATGYAASFASSSATRLRGRKPPASGGEVIAPDSFHRSDSCCFAAGAVANSTPLPYQATTVGIQRVHRRNSRQRRVPLRSREVASQPGAHHAYAGLSESCNRNLKNLFKSTAISASTRPGPLRDFYEALLAKGMRPTLARLTLAMENRCHYFNRLEERGGLRRQTIRSASSLSISESLVSPSLVFPSGGRSGSGDARFEGKYQSMSWAASFFGSESPIFHAYAPSDNQK